MWLEGGIGRTCCSCGYCFADFGVGFWLPVLAKVVARVTGTTDYNLVQNNGMLGQSLMSPHQ